MPEPDLTISEVARRTGLTPATLRVWEKRYGFPLPVRSAGGQRTYRAGVVDQVRQVVAHRNMGVTLPVAIDRIQQDAQNPGASINAYLRTCAPSLPIQRMTGRGGR